jgi:hypothetical protein
MRQSKGDAVKAIRENRRPKKRSHIVAPGFETYELTKIDVAEALIRAAVRLFFEGGHPVPIYALASSAREILTTVGEKTGVETILHSLAKRQGTPVKKLIDQAHEYARFFKHADRDPAAKITFSETEVDPVLVLACHDFGRVTGGMPIEAQVFEAWIYTLAWQRILDAPLRKQRVLKLAIKEFPGVRTADRKRQKQIGLETLKRAERDPSLRMQIEREIKLATKA